jgi:hypothetical protein
MRRQSVESGPSQKILTTETTFVEYWSENYDKEGPERFLKAKEKAVKR